MPCFLRVLSFVASGLISVLVVCELTRLSSGPDRPLVPFATDTISTDGRGAGEISI